MVKRIAPFVLVCCVLLAAFAAVCESLRPSFPDAPSQQSVTSAQKSNVFVQKARFAFRFGGASTHLAEPIAESGLLERPAKDGPAKDGRAKETPANTCAAARSTLLDISAQDRNGQHVRGVPVWQLPNRRAFFFISGMTIDADGSPNAYHPLGAGNHAGSDAGNDTGLDELANAGEPGNWNGIITDQKGDPLIQQETDPSPGYYISCTSLSDKTKMFRDPTRYVDASKIPYVVLPQDIADRGGASLGDFAVVVNLRNGKSSFAIYADIGTLGEGSVELANALGIQSDARHGGESDGILYLLFPGSGNRRPRTLVEIQSEGEKLVMDQRIEMTKLSTCVESDNPEKNAESGALRVNWTESLPNSGDSRH
jgi:hypothetical protein